MALDDDDKAWISEQIAAGKQPPATRGRPQVAREFPEERGRGDYDDLTPQQTQRLVRREVEAALKEQDREWELQDLRARNAELEEAQKKGQKPSTQKRTEQAPSIVTKLQKMVWGETPAER